MPPQPAFNPLYGQIKELIVQSMQRGDWKPGELMPSENELATRFAVSQGTVRKAIDELAAENLVTRRQGKGTFVATHTEQNVQYRFLRLVPDNGDPASEGPAQRTILACERTRATSDVARALGLKPGEAVMHAKRLLSFGGVPTVLEDIWLPGGTFKGLCAQQLAQHPGSTYSLYESGFNTRMVRAEERIRATTSTVEASELLHLALGTPLLSVERVAFTYSDVPMELRRALYCTETHHYANPLS